MWKNSKKEPKERKCKKANFKKTISRKKRLKEENSRRKVLCRNIRSEQIDVEAL